MRRRDCGLWCRSRHARRILAPESASPAKIAQMQVFGADVQLVPGPRDATEREALRQAEEIFYASHNWHPSSFRAKDDCL